jgi:large subunit ribosomal protein L29
MKVDELRILEVDELDGRLRAARRELYELRFKHAVGQLENSSEIAKVRHDIARIMTVLRERDFGILASAPEAGAVTSAVQALEAGTSLPLQGEGEGGGGDEQEAAPETPKPKRTRKAKTTEEGA